MSSKKLCITCGITNGAKAIDQFHYKNKAKGTRQDRCIECAKEYAKKHYNENKEKRLQQINERQNAVRIENRKLYAEFISTGKCSVCDESDSRCLTSNISNDDILYKNSPIISALIESATIHCLNCDAKKD